MLKNKQSTIEDLQDAIRACRVVPGKAVRLSHHSTDFPEGTQLAGKQSRKKIEQLLTQDVSQLAKEQEKLYAADSWSLLVIFQAIDAAGKDGTIKHVMSGLNPQGCQVYSFKHPSSEELDHNFLWRYTRALPERGRIGIFNRSYYEEVLIVKVHPELLTAQRIPDTKDSSKVWRERYEDINNLEKHLTRNGTLILKFFLHLSKDEQRKRFLDRIEDPKKQWKFSSADLTERGYWDDYMHAYEEALTHTSTEWAPWYVVPADNKWATRTLVANTIVQGIRKLNVRFPSLGAEQKKELKKARKLLSKEK